MKPATAPLKPIRSCVVCGSPIIDKREGTLYCGSRCDQTAWRERHPGLAIARAVAWNRDHPSRRREINRAFESRHPEGCLERTHVHRARKLNAECGHVTVRWVFEHSGGRCHICGQLVDWTLRGPDPLSKSLDHLIPLSKGGSHGPGNVRLAHLRCNQRKGSRLIEQGELSLGA